MRRAALASTFALVLTACASRSPSPTARPSPSPVRQPLDAAARLDASPEETPHVAVQQETCAPTEPDRACPSWAADPGDAAAERAFAEATRLQRAQDWEGCREAVLGALVPSTGETRALALARVGAECVARARSARTPRPRGPAPAWTWREALPFRTIVCASPEVDDARVSAEYWLARGPYEAGRYAESVPWFSHVATAHSDHEVAPYAAALWLDALNSTATHPGSDAPRCFAELGRVASLQVGLFCRERRARNEEHCAILERLLAQVARLDAGVR